MDGLLYRPDIDEVRTSLTTWWHGGDIGRPAMAVKKPREDALEDLPEMSPPEGWTTHYSTKDLNYRIHLSKIGPAGAEYYGEALPWIGPDLAPNCLALYLGCEGIEQTGTVWCKPFINDPENTIFGHDPDNFYWNFTLKLAEEQKKISEGRCLLHFPDLIEGLDTLEAMRGGQNLIFDLYDRPEWVHECLKKITDLYFYYYNRLYELLQDETGGSCFWAWAPGKTAKFQCDFSAMLSPELFGEFMVPVLEQMTQKVDYSIYHWDGPDALKHWQHLVNIPELDVIQWVAGAGEASSENPAWWPYYHRILDAGKGVMIQNVTLDGLKALKREFGEKWKQFFIRTSFGTREEIDQAFSIAEDD